MSIKKTARNMAIIILHDRFNWGHRIIAEAFEVNKKNVIRAIQTKEKWIAEWAKRRVK